MHRRKFLTTSAGLALSGLRLPKTLACDGDRIATAVDSSSNVTVTRTPPDAQPNSFYIGNRRPLLRSPLVKLPIGSIEPRGWLHKQLVLMANGMTGRLTEISEWLKPNSGWLVIRRQQEVAYKDDYQEVPYWLRGFGDLGYLLKDEKIISESRRWLNAVLSSQQEDGYFGPLPNREEPDLWPNMPMLDALQSLYEATGDKRVLPFMARYFRYELNLPRKRLLPSSWQKFRGGDNLASVYWLYNRTTDPWLLDLSKVLHEQTVDWTSTIPHPGERGTWGHGVNITEGFREPATYYQQAKDSKFLEATERNYTVVMDEYGQVPGGMFAADENLRSGFVGPSQAAETCSMVEFMKSFEMLLLITGNPIWADWCEDVAFNSLPAAMTPSLRGLHYLTAPNLVQCDPSEHHVFQNVGYMLPFSPRDVYFCCQHNVAMGWPYYSEHLWAATSDNGLAALLYAPCSVEARVGHGVRVRIEEQTDYPFGEIVELEVASRDTVRFPLLLRVPAWCEAASVAVNERRLPIEALPRSYITIERVWKDRDRVSLSLPMPLVLRTWQKQGNAVSLRSGPLWFSLRVGQNWEKIGGTYEWPELAVYPTSPWNFGLIIDGSNPAKSFRLLRKSRIAKQPFDLPTSPVELRGKGRAVQAWKLAQNSAGPVPASPVTSGQIDQDITLVPMGCARLRISVFPRVGQEASTGRRVELDEQRPCSPA